MDSLDALPLSAPLDELARLGAIEHEALCLIRSTSVRTRSIEVTRAGYTVTPHVGPARTLPHGWTGVEAVAGEAAEAIDAAAHERLHGLHGARQVGDGVAARCVCWHRADGSHVAGCPAAEVRDALPAWRRVPVEVREYRGKDAHGRSVFEAVRSTRLVAPAARVESDPEREREREPGPEPDPIASDPGSGPELVAVVDTETTGLRPDGRVCEIAFAVVDIATGEILQRASQFVDPGVPMPPGATAIHGITDAMLAGKPRLHEVWPRIVAFVERHCPGLDGLDVVAHNAPFDRGILSDDLARYGLLSCDWPRWRWRDSITLAKRIVPGLATYSLHDSQKGRGLASVLGLDKGKSHRAMGDVLTTCALLVELRRRAGKPFSEWCGDAHVWGVGVVGAVKGESASKPVAKRAGARPSAVDPRTPDLFAAPKSASGDR